MDMGLSCALLSFVYPAIDLKNSKYDWDGMTARFLRQRFRRMSHSIRAGGYTAKELGASQLIWVCPPPQDDATKDST